MKKIIVLTALHVADDTTADEIEFLVGTIEAQVMEPVVTSDEEIAVSGDSYFIRYYTGSAAHVFEGALTVGLEGSDDDAADGLWNDISDLINLNKGQ